MVRHEGTLRVAAVQAEPVWLDADGTLDRTEELVAAAADDGVDLVGFPETWLPGYPWWIWLDAPAAGMPLVGRYHANSVTVDGARMERLRSIARKHGVGLVVGVSERDGGSLYMSQAIIDATGDLLALRRKLKPTHVERSVFGEGDGSDLVVTGMGSARVGALNCWEHLQPLMRMAMFGQHEQVHVASWPSFALYRGAAFALGPEVNLAASRTYAAEGQCFVIAATQVIGESAYDVFGGTDVHRQYLQLGGGFSMIFGPDGRELAEPLPETAEGLVAADIDLSLISLAKNAADPVGHYARPDALQLHVDRTDRRAVVDYGADRGGAHGAADEGATLDRPAADPTVPVVADAPALRPAAT